jgi:hypothetical protein
MTQITTLNQAILDLNTTKQELQNDLEESHDIIKEAKKGIFNHVTPPYCCMPIHRHTFTQNTHISLRKILPPQFTLTSILLLLCICGF